MALTADASAREMSIVDGHSVRPARGDVRVGASPASLGGSSTRLLGPRRPESMTAILGPADWERNGSKAIEAGKSALGR